MTIPGFSKLNIRSSVIRNTIVPNGLINAILDSNATSPMTVEYFPNGHAKKMSIYICLLDPSEDGPFISSWTPRALYDARHLIDENYPKAKYGFIWADLQQLAETPHRPYRPSTQPLISFLHDIFTHRGHDILARVVQMDSLRETSRHRPPAAPPRGEAARVPYEQRIGEDMGYNPNTAVRATPLPSPPTDSFSRRRRPPDEERSTSLATAVVPTAAIVSQNSVFPSSVSIALPPSESSLSRNVTGSSAAGPARADDDEDLLASGEPTQLERQILSAASDEAAVIYLLRSELHKRVLRVTLPSCRRCDGELGQLYAKMMKKGDRSQFITFLRVQCKIYSAMFD